MDQTRLRHILTHLHDVITNDVPGLQFRIHFYGSRQRGPERSDSNLDLAIEIRSPMEDGEASRRNHRLDECAGRGFSSVCR